MQEGTYDIQVTSLRCATVNPRNCSPPPQPRVGGRNGATGSASLATDSSVTSAPVTCSTEKPTKKPRESASQFGRTRVRRGRQTLTLERQSVGGAGKRRHQAGGICYLSSCEGSGRGTNSIIRFPKLKL